MNADDQRLRGSSSPAKKTVARTQDLNILLAAACSPTLSFLISTLILGQLTPWPITLESLTPVDLRLDHPATHRLLRDAPN